MDFASTVILSSVIYATAMSTSDLKLNLIQRVLLANDAYLLECVRAILDRESIVADDFTDEEIAELEEIDRRRKAGLDTYVSAEEAMRMAREALNRKEN